MRLLFLRAGGSCLLGLALLASGSTALAQYYCPPQPCPQPYAPQAATAAPGEQAPAMPDATLPAPPAPAAPQFAMSEQFGATGSGTFAMAQSNVGYIDSALPWSQFRLRYDSAWNNPVPDRAEFFYPMCGCQTPGVPGPGPELPETGVDYQDIATYLEVALSPRFSTFIEVPIRFLDPEVNANTSGLADVNAGFKYALWRTCREDRYLTFQLKTYIPTGDGDRGLGTDEWGVEPGLLYFNRLTKRLTLEGEVRDWFSLSDNEVPNDVRQFGVLAGEDFGGNVLRYGIGAGYDLIQNSCRQSAVTGVVEFVGWTVLDGLGSSVEDGLFDASGDTIVNVKAGTRFTLGEDSVYVGYGHALTGDVWYEDILRVEYRAYF